MRPGKIMQFIVNILLLTSLFLQLGCPATLRNRQLENVAKDWSWVIRASQVIPVYPLTEDLQPGDVLLVRTPIGEQVKLYEQKGFLPLDQHLVRLYSKDYYDFYNARYGITSKDIIPPAPWQSMSGGSHKWAVAPYAAFPSYAFSVRTGAGLNLAIPIQGVPFAMGLMNSGNASGSVTIAKAHTYGLDNYHLEKMVREWALHYRNLLRAYEPQESGNYHFLRVISRVYVAESMTVTINNDEAAGAEAAAGSDRPVNLMGIKEGATADNYEKAVTSINKLLESQIPGVKTKIAMASSRSVTLTQPFERPLVIGYIGFDMPILKGGRLGASISTLAQLTETKSQPAGQAGEATVYRLAAFSHINAALKKMAASGNESAKDILRRLNTLSELLPDTCPFPVYHQPSPGTIEVLQAAGHRIEKKQGFEAVTDYLSSAETSRNVLDSYLRTAPQATDEQKRLAGQYRQAMQQTQSATQEIEGRLYDKAVLREAIDVVFFE